VLVAYIKDDFCGNKAVHYAVAYYMSDCEVWSEANTCEEVFNVIYWINIPDLKLKR
jgi:hypothetical protein